MNSVEFTSEAVRSAKFREKLKGYHPEDVDAFLERAAAALEQMSARLAEATARAMKAEEALAGHSEADESVRKTLILAQRTADMAINEAKEEARQLREAAETEAVQLREAARAEATAERASAESDAAELRAQAEQLRSAAVQQAAETVEEADAVARSQLSDAAERLAGIEREAQAEHDRSAAEATRQAEEAVRALLHQQQQLRADVGALARYLAGERARVLEVLTTAVERFGETLAPARPNDVGEIDRSLDREGLAKGSADPAAEDSWSFDPTVLKQPENQWWSSPTDGEGSPSTPPLGSATPLANEGLPEWFTSAVATAAPPTTPVPGPSPAPVDEATEAEPASPAENAGTGDDEEPPARLLFTLEDESRRADDEDPDPMDLDKSRKTLLGRRRV